MNETTRTDAALVGRRVGLDKRSGAAGVLVWAIIVCCLGYGAPAARAGLKVYYLRHAEYGGNVVKQWEGKPKSEWPAYVGRGDMFTPKGKEQVAALTKKLLKDYHFDFVAVSPAWRTKNTIAPYLKAAGMTAEVWPELLEFNDLHHQHDADLPAPSGDLWSGRPVKLEAGDEGLFTVRAGDPKGFKVGRDSAQAAADRRAVVDRVIELVKQRFGGSDKSILLVGHGNSGRIMAEELTHEPKAFEKEPHNTGMWMAEEQADGSFKLMMLDDKPFKSAAREGVHAAP